MYDSRFGCVESEREGCRGSISAAEKERFLEGERKELGDREKWRCVGDGLEAMGGRRLSLLKDSGCSFPCWVFVEAYAVRSVIGSAV